MSNEYGISKETIESNQMIKEFMGKEIRGKFGRILSVHEYQYHYSWDWIMPVVEKINMDFNNVKIFNLGCQITTEIDVRNKESLIECVWLAVVEFIKHQSK